ncbi:MAG: beta-lactamase family protein [Proteobacteria bacterium]|nr:beta-lactamase family protein [Pseudomonadota bacterium]
MPTESDAPVRFNRREALLLTAGALAATSVRAGTPAATAPKAWAGVEQRCRQLVADRVVPGISVCAQRDGRTVYAAGFGMANLETSTPVTSASVFKIGSISKQFTAAAITLLAQDGKLSLDDTLARFLPLFPRARDVTLRQMLTHTSGLGNYTEMASPEAFMQAARTDYDNSALIAAMAATKPLFKFEPGTGWAYSNTAYVLLGLVVEIAGGEPYQAFFRRRLFEPAGLASTAVDDAAEVVPQRVSGYSPREGAPTGFANASFISMTFPHGAGALRSTSEDLCRWHGALLGGRVVNAASLEQMLTPGRLANGSLPPTPAGMAAITGNADKPMEYGFGLMFGDFEGRRYVEHDGGINGFVSALRSFRTERVTVAMLVNTDGFRKPELAKTLFEVRDTAARTALAAG